MASKRAIDLSAGDKIGSFVVARNEPYVDTARTWTGVEYDIDMVEIIGLRVLFGNVSEDSMTFAANALIECDPFIE